MLPHIWILLWTMAGADSPLNHHLFVTVLNCLSGCIIVLLCVRSPVALLACIANERTQVVPLLECSPGNKNLSPVFGSCFFSQHSPPVCCLPQVTSGGWYIGLRCISNTRLSCLVRGRLTGWIIHDAEATLVDPSIHYAWLPISVLKWLKNVCLNF